MTTTSLSLDDLKAQFAQISAEHAVLWRGLTMTDQWRRLQAQEPAARLESFYEEQQTDGLHT